MPLVAGEIGQGDCQHDFIDTVMNWMDARQQGYLFAKPMPRGQFIGLMRQRLVGAPAAVPAR